MKPNQVFLPLLLFLMLAAGTAVILVSASNGGELFVDLPAGSGLPQGEVLQGETPPGLELPGPEVIRTRYTGVSLPAAEGMRSGDTLSLHLFEDAVYTFVADSSSQDGSFLSVTGYLQDQTDSLAVMTVGGGQLVLDVFNGAEIYQVRSLQDGIYSIAQIDQSLYPQELPPVEVTPEMLMEVGRTNFQPSQQIADDNGSQIDVLVIYTVAARNAAGGAAAIQNLITSAISVTNVSYNNSAVAPRLNLVGMSETSYVESGDMGQDLSRLGGINDGFMDEVHNLRDLYHADLVNLIVNTGQYCGIAYQMQSVDASFGFWAFSVVQRTCAVGNLSFAHELGHNMGARHDWYVDSGTQPYRYSHGHLNFANRWRTVMSYDNYCQALGASCNRIPYWSNPNLTYGGVPLGVAENTCTGGVGCDADNARTLNNTAYTVANFRVGTTPTPTPTRTRTPTPTVTPTPTRTPTPTPTQPYKVLLVDEDDNNPDVRSYYTAPLAALKATVTVLDVEPNAGQLAQNESTIWFTGDNYTSVTGPSETAEGLLAQWLDAGGCLFITSADYAWIRVPPPQPPNNFMINYLGVADIAHDNRQSVVKGSGSLFAGFGPYSLVMPAGYTDNYFDNIIPNQKASAAFIDSTGSAGDFYESQNFKSMYWGFPFDAIPGLQDRVNLLKRFLRWCRYYDTFMPLLSR